MSKKLFALAGCTALAGTVFAAAASGCSSTTTTNGGTGDSGTSSGSVDSGKKTPVDSGGSSGTDSAPPVCPDTTVIPTATIDAQWAWKAPKGIQSVCVAGDIAAVNAAFNNMSNQTYDDVVKQISPGGSGPLPSGAACLACMTSKEGDANYGYLVQLTDNTQMPPQFYIDNSGGCFALETTSACGQAITYLNYCAGLACGGCTDNTSFGNCLGAKGVATACAAEITTFQSSCNAYLTDLQNMNSALNAACGDPIDGISAMCADGTYDGGKLDGAP
jgi:hypothetical protein